MTDVIIARFDPATLYAGIVGNAGANAAQNGVYQSTDSGANWTQLSGGLPSGTVLGDTNFGGAVRLEAGTKSGVVYVTMLSNGQSASPQVINTVQRFKTGDGGATWTALAATPGSLENRPWHLMLAVDPSDDLHVFANDAYSLYESTDAGTTWSHADAGTGYLTGGKNTFDWVNLSFDANDNAVVTADQGAFLYTPGATSEHPGWCNGLYVGGAAFWTGIAVSIALLFVDPGACSPHRNSDGHRLLPLVALCAAGMPWSAKRLRAGTGGAR